MGGLVEKFVGIGLPLLTGYFAFTVARLTGIESPAIFTVISVLTTIVHASLFFMVYHKVHQQPRSGSGDVEGFLLIAGTLCAILFVPIGFLAHAFIANQFIIASTIGVLITIFSVVALLFGSMLFKQ